MSVVRRGVEGLRWYLKQVSGEARWETYLERCTKEGVEPMTRREYERHRSEVREHNPASRCC